MEGEKTKRQSCRMDAEISSSAPVKRNPSQSLQEKNEQQFSPGAAQYNCCCSQPVWSVGRVVDIDKVLAIGGVGMCSELRVLRLGSCASRPSQKGNERERRNHQKTPRTVPDRPVIPHPFPGVSCRSFFANLHARLFALRFCSRQLDFPSWFRHRVPWPQSSPPGVVRFSPPGHGGHATRVPDCQVPPEGPWV